MQLLILLSLCTSLHHCGADFPFGINLSFDDSSPKPQFINEADESLFSSSDSSDVYNASVFREDPSQIFNNENSSLTDQINSTSTSVNQSLSSTSATSNVPSTSSNQNMETLTAIFNNESHSQSSNQYSSRESSAATTSSNYEQNKTASTTDDEPEGVARGKPSSTQSTSTITSRPQTLYDRTWALISDTYTLSILIPVTAGVVFATTIMLIIAICRCLKRRCLRRRLRKKILPDSVKNLRPSDRARLLTESSDEEF